MNPLLTPEPQTRMSIQERLQLRKKLQVSAGEMELLELIGSGPMTLQRLAEQLSMSVRGVDKSANRLIEQGHLVKIASKLNLSKTCALLLNVELCSITYNKERSNDLKKDIEQSSTNGIEQSYISYLEIEQSSMNDMEQSSTFSQKQELSSINQPNQEQSSTFLPDDSHAPTHGGSSIFLIKNFDTLKEEKNKEEKINPPNPLDKKQENKKEEIRVRRQNRAARVMICGLMLHKAQKRQGKRLKRLPKANKKRRSPKVQPIAIMPVEWSTELKQALTEWLEYKAEKRSVYKPKGLEGLIKSINTHPAKAVIWAIQDAISKNYHGFFPQNYSNNGKSNGNRKTGYGIGSVPNTVEKADSLVIRLDELGDIEF